MARERGVQRQLLEGGWSGERELPFGNGSQCALHLGFDQAFDDASMREVAVGVGDDLMWSRRLGKESVVRGLIELWTHPGDDRIADCVVVLGVFAFGQLSPPVGKLRFKYCTLFT